ncbi:MAG TPA: peptidylprolyl isomerase, partial [Bacteroidia bacterium]|nr:peptidylprolyl isomerase [Bacteroidia bacterium]
MTTSKLKGYLIFLLCIYFGKAISQPQILDQVAAIVGSKIILQSEVEQQYQVYLSQGNYAKP